MFRIAGSRHRRPTPSVFRTPVILLAIGLPILGLRAQFVVSDFNVNSDGWQKYAGADAATVLSYSATGGVGGTGAIVLDDPANGKDDYFLAPAKFLGNMSAYYGGTLSFDLKLNPNWSTVYTVAMVVLTGTYNLSPLSIGYLPPSGQYPNATNFTSFTFTLDPTTAWKHTDSNDLITGTTATTAEIQAVLGSLSALRIWGDWTTSPDHDVLDNVALTAIPEPAAWVWAAVIGAAGVLLAARRR